MKAFLAVASATSLITCTVVAFLYFYGSLTMGEYKLVLFIASIAYFVFATLWATRPKTSS
jgi:hypothetical protein